MSTVPTLYSICFDYLKTHTEEITSLEGIPFNSVVLDLLDYLFTSEISLNHSILSVISHSHSKALREANLDETKLFFNRMDPSMYSVLRTINHNFPKFITYLNIGFTDLCDDDIYLLNDCTNLKELCFATNRNITDRTVSYIATMTLNISNGRGLPYLETLNFEHVKGITDKSLKFFGKMKYLSFIELSKTQVNADVAKPYLKSQGYQFVDTLMSIWGSKNKLQKFIVHHASSIESVPANREAQKINHSESNNISSRFLTFIRTPWAITKKRAPSEPIKEKRHVKQQKMDINDFCNMVEAEFTDDDD